MTLDEFFRKLPRTGWKLTPDGAIRCKDGRCPLERRADVPHYQWKRAGRILRLRRQDRNAVICAADDLFIRDDHPFRARLLRHCGLAKRGRK
jgi:hypothetical protein